MGGGVTLGTLGGRNPWLSWMNKNMAEKKGLQNRWLGSWQPLQKTKRWKSYKEAAKVSRNKKKCGWFVLAAANVWKKHVETHALKEMTPKKNGVFEA